MTINYANCSETESLQAWFADHESRMTDLLARLVNTDSNSYDKAGTDAVGVILQQFLEADGIAVERLAVERHGDVFVARLPGTRAGKPVMLMGHRDTVFPTGEAARRPFTIRNARAYGPGVADMKAGLVQNAFILAAFKELGLPHLPLVAMASSDEEIGTPACRGILERQLRGIGYAFNAEPGRASGNVVTSRRGGIFFRAGVTGRAAHSGNAFTEGRSAILALARKIEAWMALTDPVADVTVNVGLVSGGQSVNTVAPFAEARIDLRYTAPADRDRMVAAISAIATRVDVPDTTGEIAIVGEFLPVCGVADSTRALLALHQESARAAGFAVDGEFTQSSADSGLPAAMGIPTLCGMGPVGGKGHTAEEFLELDTVVPRAVAQVLTILNLPGSGI